MKMRALLLVIGILSFESNGVNCSFEACGEMKNDDVESIINATVDRLMEFRNKDWGWTNTPEVVLGLQLSAQKKFFGRNETIQAMKNEIPELIDTMNIGKLALYVTAVQSSCMDPTSFAGYDLLNILDRRIKKQFFYNKRKQTVPYDRYYRFGLALGALCVNGRQASGIVIRNLLLGQNADGSFGDIHSVDGSAQILLALECISQDGWSGYQLCQIRAAIAKLVTFLVLQVKKEGEKMWIGNKFSSPSSVLGLTESGNAPPEQWHCGDIMRSLALEPDPLDKEGGLSQRLPVLRGKSYLSLKSSTWQCENPVATPAGYEPRCDPTDPSTCNPAPPTTVSPPSMISVRLTVYTDPPPSNGMVPNVDITLTDVPEGSTLFQVMTQAEDDGLITFESTSTSWGQSIRSIQNIAADREAHEYWSLINGKTGLSLTRGASSYIPGDGGHVAFRLKTW